MQLHEEALQQIIKTALAEDIGTGDITSNLTIPQDSTSTMMFNTREPIVVCGLSVVEKAMHAVDDSITITLLVKEGDSAPLGTNLIKVEGNTRSILAVERVALNLFQHMSAIATLAKLYSMAVNGTDAKVLDTRKTTPGLRMLEKYAVTIGGCHNHRYCLDDAILIKDNHIHAAGGIEQVLSNVKAKNMDGLKVEIECDTLDQVRLAIKGAADIIMLDNMNNADMKEAVGLVAYLENRPLLEASGGVTLHTIRRIAETGVDHISVGALTHSAGNADIGLDGVE
jgi:nicotinate-nucleotide pyrophosphorylase (carboxylating)